MVGILSFPRHLLLPALKALAETDLETNGGNTNWWNSMVFDMAARSAMFEIIFILVFLFILLRVGRIFFPLGESNEPQVSIPSQSPALETSPSPITEVVPDNARVEPQDILHDDELNTMQLNINSENQ